jgi:hypothetical protein
MWAQLSSDSLGWSSQYRELKRWLQSKNYLCIILGDLNTLSDFIHYTRLDHIVGLLAYYSLV